MNKFKKIMLGLASVLTLGIIAVTGAKVNAASTTVFNANNGTEGTVQAKNTDFASSNSYLSIKSQGATSTYGADYVVGNSYSLGLWFSNNTKSTKGFLFTNKSSIESIEITAVFAAYNNTSAVAVSSYFTTDTTNTVTTSTTNTVSLTTSLDAGASAYLVTTGRQTALYEVSYTTGIVYHSVTIVSDGVSIEKSIQDGDKIDALDNMYAYTFAGYYTDQDYETVFDYENTTITSDITLYARWNSLGYFTNDYLLSTTCLNPLATSIGSSTALESDLKVNSIYTILTGCKGYTSNGGAITTNGGLAVTQKGLKVDLSNVTKGSLIVKISCGGNSARNAKLINSGGTAITAYSGNVEWPTDSEDWYTVRTISYPIDNPGVYYLGGDNSMRIFSVQYTPYITSDTSAEVTAYQNTAKTSLMFVGKLTGITDIANIKSIELVLTKNEVAANQNLSLTTCYTSVTYTKSDSTEDTTTYAAATNTYYVIGKITGIDSTIFPDNTAITCKLVVTFTDDSTTTSETINFTWNN